jgi:hypothetical protein
MNARTDPHAGGHDALIQQALDAGHGAGPTPLMDDPREAADRAEAHLMDKLFALTSRMEAFEQRLGALERNLSGNTDATARIEANTRALVEVFESWKGAMRVLEWVGKAARPLAYVASAAAAIVGLVYAIKGGTPPKP